MVEAGIVKLLLQVRAAKPGVGVIAFFIGSNFLPAVGQSQWIIASVFGGIVMVRGLHFVLAETTRGFHEANWANFFGGPAGGPFPHTVFLVALIAAWLMTGSVAVRQKLLRGNKSFQVIHNGIAPLEPQSGSESLGIGFIGRFVYQKNPQLFLEVVKRLPGWRKSKDPMVSFWKDEQFLANKPGNWCRALIAR